MEIENLTVDSETQSRGMKIGIIAVHRRREVEIERQDAPPKRRGEHAIVVIVVVDDRRRGVAVAAAVIGCCRVHGRYWCNLHPWGGHRRRRHPWPTEGLHRAAHTTRRRPRRVSLNRTVQPPRTGRNPPLVPDPKIGHLSAGHREIDLRLGPPQRQRRGVVCPGRVLRRVERPQPDPGFLPRISDLGRVSSPRPLPHASEFNILRFSLMIERCFTCGRWIYGPSTPHGCHSRDSACGIEREK